MGAFLYAIVLYNYIAGLPVSTLNEVKVGVVFFVWQRGHKNSVNVNKRVILHLFSHYM